MDLPTLTSRIASSRQLQQARSDTSQRAIVTSYSSTDPNTGLVLAKDAAGGDVVINKLNNLQYTKGDAIPVTELGGTSTSFANGVNV